MKNQEFAQKLENATTLESVMNLRNTVTAPAYIAACKEKALKVKGDYVLYSSPMSTFNTDCVNIFAGLKNEVHAISHIEREKSIGCFLSHIIKH